MWFLKILFRETSHCLSLLATYCVRPLCAQKWSKLKSSPHLSLTSWMTLGKSLLSEPPLVHLQRGDTIQLPCLPLHGTTSEVELGEPEPRGALCGECVQPLLNFPVIPPCCTQLCRVQECFLALFYSKGTGPRTAPPCQRLPASSPRKNLGPGHLSLKILADYDRGSSCLV